MVKQLSNNQASIPSQNLNEETVTDDSTKAIDILNKEFYNNFRHLKDLASSVMSRLSTQPECCPVELLCTEDQVYELIMQLDNQKSSGTDNVSARMLIRLQSTLSSLLLPKYLTCQSIRTGRSSPPAGKQQGQSLFPKRDAGQIQQIIDLSQFCRF